MSENASFEKRVFSYGFADYRHGREKRSRKSLISWANSGWIIPAARKAADSSQIGPVKFFDEGWYRRTAAWRDSTEEMQSLDGTAFIEAKRKKCASASAADARR